VHPGAQAVKVDLALRSVVAQESIVADDAEIDDEVARLAERLEQKPAKVRRDLERNGAIEALRSDLARNKAARLLVDHAVVVDEEGEPVDLTLPEGASADGEDPGPPEEPTEPPDETDEES